MASQVYVVVSLAFLVVTVADPVDQGPQTFEKKPAAPVQQYREVIMYLTPTQIRAYEKSQRPPGSDAEIKPIVEPEYPTSNDTASSLRQQYFELEQAQRESEQAVEYQRQAARNHEQEQLRIAMQQQPQPQPQPPPQLQPQRPQQPSNLQQVYSEPIKGGSNQFRQLAPQIQFTANDNIQPFTKEQNFAPSQPQTTSYIYINDMSRQIPAPVTSKLMFYPEPEFLRQMQQAQLQHQTYLQRQKEKDLLEKYQLIPYEYITENRHNHENLGKQLLGYPQLRLINDQENIFKPKYSVTRQEEQQESHQSHSEANREHKSQLQYAPNYYDIENIVNSIQLEKLQARAHAEAIANSPPVIIHKDVTIKKIRPITTHLIKSVKVPTPILVPVPQPYQVKVPQPYPVPLEIIRPFAVPIVKTEKVEVEKPVPVPVEKHVAVPVDKKVYVKVEKPYTVERIVPVEVKKEVPVEVPIYKPEKFTIVRHIWDH